MEGWHKLIDVCYAAEKFQTLYTTHVLHGGILCGAVVDSNRPEFDVGQEDFYKGFNPLQYYKKVRLSKIK